MIRPFGSEGGLAAMIKQGADGKIDRRISDEGLVERAAQQLYRLHLIQIPDVHPFEPTRRRVCVPALMGCVELNHCRSRVKVNADDSTSFTAIGSPRPCGRVRKWLSRDAQRIPIARRGGTMELL